jgi:pSer/pThr/pTyr-binding forkhead associated (FHA) protein
MKPYLIGRRRDCDVVISDPSVSRHHAELVGASNAEFLLVDRESKFGTFVKRNGEWCRITTTRVQIDDLVRLGRHETSIRDLLASAAERSQVPGDGGAPPTRTLIERNPETGEIIARRER